MSEVFRNISTNKFELNGIQYFKNFLIRVIADSILLANVYDTRFVLLASTHYSQVSISSGGNLVTYESVADLVANLNDIVYFRSGQGGGPGEIFVETFTGLGNGSYQTRTVNHNLNGYVACVVEETGSGKKVSVPVQRTDANNAKLHGFFKGVSYTAIFNKLQ